MNPEDLLLGPALGAWLRAMGRPDGPGKTPKPPSNASVPLPTDRPTQAASEDDDVAMVQPDNAQPPFLTVPGESRPIGQQPVRFLRRPDGSPGFTFVVDPSSGAAIRWVPPGAGQGQAMTPGERRTLRQNPGAPAPGQLPPRSVAAPPPTPEELAEMQRLEAAQRAADNLAAQQMFQQATGQPPTTSAPVQPRAIDRLVRNPNAR